MSSSVIRAEHKEFLSLALYPRRRPLECYFEALFMILVEGRPFCHSENFVSVTLTVLKSTDPFRTVNVELTFFQLFSILF